MNNIKLFEEYYWDTRDNDIANKIIYLLKNDLNFNKISKIDDHTYSYVLRKDNIKNDIDPYQEDNWNDDGYIEVFSMSDYDPTDYTNSLNIFIKDDNGKIQDVINLKTNKKHKIFRILKKAYKNKEIIKNREKLKKYL